jgi:hypothetical protein
MTYVCQPYRLIGRHVGSPPVLCLGSYHHLKNFFLIGIVGGGVLLVPLGNAATNRPIVPAPGDYDGGDIGGVNGRGNRSTRRKPAPMSLCPQQTSHAARTRTRAAAVGSQRLTLLTYGSVYMKMTQLFYH